MSTQIGGGGGRQRYGFQSLVRVVLNEHERFIRIEEDGAGFQSLVRVVLNEHSREGGGGGGHAAVSIPRSGCAE